LPWSGLGIAAGGAGDGSGECQHAVAAVSYGRRRGADPACGKRAQTHRTGALAARLAEAVANLPRALTLFISGAKLSQQDCYQCQPFKESPMSVTSIVSLVVLALVLFYLVSLYNKLVTLRNRFKNGFAQIDVQL